MKKSDKKPEPKPLAKVPLVKAPYKPKHIKGKYLERRQNHAAFIPEWRLVKFSDGTAYTIQNKQLAQLAKAGPSVMAKIRITPTVTMTKTDRFFTFSKTVKGKEENVVLDITNATIRELFASDDLEDGEEDEWSHPPDGSLEAREARALAAGEDVWEQETILDEIEESGGWRYGNNR